MSFLAFRSKRQRIYGDVTTNRKSQKSQSYLRYLFLSVYSIACKLIKIESILVEKWKFLWQQQAPRIASFHYQLLSWSEHSIKLVSKKKNKTSKIPNLLQCMQFFNSRSGLIVELSWRIDSNATVRASWRKIYVGWGGGTSRNPNTIELDFQFCQCLDIKNGQKVRIKAVTNDVNEAKMVVVEPNSTDDWEILVTQFLFCCIGKQK